MFLEITDLNKSFGGVKATDGVNMFLNKGEICSIIGPNGAGKTTLFNLISGYFKPDSGKVTFLDEDITGKSVRDINRLGIARSFQIVNVFPKLTVDENMMIAVLAQQRKSLNLTSDAKKVVAEKCSILLESVGLHGIQRSLAGQLSHGAQKRLEVGIALASEPKLLLLDEPTAGMAKDEKWEIIDTIKKTAKKKDITIFLSAHDMSVIFAVSEKIWVLVNGKLITSGTVDEIRNNDEVHRIYLGEKK
jgi:branched-chain amino acid transport system ATP-binding protein